MFDFLTKYILFACDIYIITSLNVASNQQL
jgi:hypothetical protein